MFVMGLIAGVLVLWACDAFASVWNCISTCRGFEWSPSLPAAIVCMLGKKILPNRCLQAGNFEDLSWKCPWRKHPIYCRSGRSHELHPREVASNHHSHCHLQRWFFSRPSSVIAMFFTLIPEQFEKREAWHLPAVKWTIFVRFSFCRSFLS